MITTHPPKPPYPFLDTADVAARADEMAIVMHYEYGYAYVLCRSPHEVAECAEVRPEIREWLARHAVTDAWLRELWDVVKPLLDARAAERAIDEMLERNKHQEEEKSPSRVHKPLCAARSLAAPDANHTKPAHQLDSP